MKLPNQLWLAGAMALLCLPLFGQTNHPVQTETAVEVPPHHHELFRAGETSLDLFGSLSIGQEVIENISKERVEDNGRLGLGVGLNHFFIRELGIGWDAYTENTQHSFVDNTSGNLIIRIPLDEIHLAPYVFGGAGYQFDPSGLWFGQAGGGLEVRFARRIGMFVDARYVFTDGTQNFGVGRLGVRIGF